MRKHNRGFRRIGATVTAVALALMGSAALAAPASAVGNLPTEDGTLTIHKYEQPQPAGAENNTGGTITVPDAWVPLTGVTFNIQAITDVDLETNEGWELAAAYAANPALATELGAATPVTTVAGGSTPATTLPIGAYLVTEVASPGATLPDGSPANIVMMAAPFVVTVPVPTDDGTWNSDVHVYPKNSLSAIAKEVGDPTGPGLGETLPWTIEVKIPTLTAGQSFTHFEIVDALDPKIEYVAGSAAMTVNGTPVEFTDNTVGQDVALAVSGTGSATLAANQGETLVVTFETTVLEAGTIENDATVYINDPGHNNGVDSNEVFSYWGSIEILKHAEGDVAQVLEGAVFTVHLSQADALAGANAITVDGQTAFETGPDGTIVIPGLWIGNEAGATATYWLHEVEAPAGYEISPAALAIEVVLTAEGADQTVPVRVENPQVPPIELPITGGEGTMALMIGGGGLLLLAAGAALVIARRRPAGVSAE